MSKYGQSTNRAIKHGSHNWNNQYKRTHINKIFVNPICNSAFTSEEMKHGLYFGSYLQKDVDRCRELALDVGIKNFRWLADKKCWGFRIDIMHILIDIFGDRLVYSDDFIKEYPQDSTVFDINSKT